LEAIACFGWRFDPKISPSLGGQGPPSNTMCRSTHTCTWQMVCKSVERFEQGARQTTDRQTDHAVEKWVRIGGIVCAARRDSA